MVDRTLSGPQENSHGWEANREADRLAAHTKSFSTVQAQRDVPRRVIAGW